LGKHGNQNLNQRQLLSRKIDKLLEKADTTRGKDVSTLKLTMGRNIIKSDEDMIKTSKAILK
jgi:hypothetical protein